MQQARYVGEKKKKKAHTATAAAFLCPNESREKREKEISDLFFGLFAIPSGRRLLNGDRPTDRGRKGERTKTVLTRKFSRQLPIIKKNQPTDYAKQSATFNLTSKKEKRKRNGRRIPSSFPLPSSVWAAPTYQATLLRRERRRGERPTTRAPPPPPPPPLQFHARPLRERSGRTERAERGKKKSLFSPSFPT